MTLPFFWFWWHCKYQYESIEERERECSRDVGGTNWVLVMSKKRFVHPPHLRFHIQQVLWDAEVLWRLCNCGLHQWEEGGWVQGAWTTLQLNTSKIEKLAVDFNRRKTPPTPIAIRGGGGLTCKLCRITGAWEYTCMYKEHWGCAQERPEVAVLSAEHLISQCLQGHIDDVLLVCGSQCAGAAVWGQATLKTQGWRLRGRCCANYEASWIMEELLHQPHAARCTAETRGGEVAPASTSNRDPNKE